MPRKPRPRNCGKPQLVRQFGLRDLEIFNGNADYEHFMANLVEASHEAASSLHAFALLPDSFLLLLTPHEEGAVSRFMQAVGRSYVSYFNRKSGRRGTLWSGRHQTCVVEPAGPVLCAYRYVEQQPVARGLAKCPLRHAWSTGRLNANSRANSLVRPHPGLQALGVTAAARAERYRALLARPLSTARTRTIDEALRRGRPFGSDQFCGIDEAVVDGNADDESRSKHHTKPDGPSKHKTGARVLEFVSRDRYCQSAIGNRKVHESNGEVR